jgi:hypothetical protein
VKRAFSLVLVVVCLFIAECFLLGYKSILYTGAFQWGDLGALACVLVGTLCGVDHAGDTPFWRRRDE